MPSSRRAASARTIPMSASIQDGATGTYTFGIVPQRSRIKSVYYAARVASGSGTAQIKAGVAGSTTAITAATAVTTTATSAAITATEAQRVLEAGEVLELAIATADLGTDIIATVELEALGF